MENNITRREAIKRMGIAEDVAQDKEGLQIMRTLGRNMAWMLRCKDMGRQLGTTYLEVFHCGSTTTFMKQTLRHLCGLSASASCMHNF